MNNTTAFNIQSLVENLVVILGIVIVSYIARRLGVRLHGAQRELHEKVEAMDQRIQIIASASGGSQ